MAATVGEAVNAKLRATAAVTAVAGTRITPQLNTQEPDYPQIVYQVIGSDSPATVKAGSGKMKAWTVRVDCYAETEAGAVALGKIVRDTLTPADPLSPWVDSGAGVIGCFHVDGSTDFTEEALRFASETFLIWFRPTS
jgi:uncharacterized protein (DUF2342 family)